MSDRDCVIVGGGVAGIEAAAALRAKDAGARIAVLVPAVSTCTFGSTSFDVVSGRLSVGVAVANTSTCAPGST